MKIMNKRILVGILFYLISFAMFADEIVSTTVTWRSGEYVVFYNKTTGDKWAEMKKHPSTRGWVLVPNYFPLDDGSQAMMAYCSGDAGCNGVPKGYYGVRKLLNGCFENETYDVISSLNTELREVERDAFRNTQVSVVRFHAVGNSRWQGSKDNIIFNTITGPVPYHINAEYVFIADAQYDAWKSDPFWCNDDLIRCTNYEDGVTSYDPIELDYSEQPTIRASKESSVLYTNKIGNQYWEYSRDNGSTWTKVESHKSYFVDEYPPKGQTWYRVLTAENEYINFVINYYDRIPGQISIIADAANKTVEESAVLSLDVQDDNYTYQWYKNGQKIVDANQNTYSINYLHTEDAGLYTCKITNPVGSVVSDSYNLTVEKGEQTLPKIELGELVYSADNRMIKVPLFTNKGLRINYTSSADSIVSYNGTKLVINKPGTANIVASQEGDKEYKPIKSTPIQVIIKKGVQTINPFAIEEREYSEWNWLIELKDTVSSVGLPIKYSSTNTEVATVDKYTSKLWYVEVQGIGETEIVATQSGNEYYEATSFSTRMVVRKGKQSYESGIPDVLSYGDKTPINGYSDKGMEMELSSNDNNIVVVVNDTIYPVHPGNTSIHYIQKGNNYFDPIEGDIPISIIKGTNPITILSALNVVYSEEPYELRLIEPKGQEYSITSSDETIVSTIGGNYLQLHRSGSTTVTVNFSENEFYASNRKVLPFSIEQAPQEIQVLLSSVIEYNGSDVRYKISDVASAKTEVTCFSLANDIISVEGDELIIHKPGKTSLIFVANANEKYKKANDVKFDISIVDKNNPVLDESKTVSIDYDNHNVKLTSLSNCVITNSVEISLKDYNLANQSVVSQISLPNNSIIQFEIGNGTVEPKYYSNTNGIRVYANNRILFYNTEHEDIANITLTCDGSYLGNNTATFEQIGDALVYTNYIEDTGGTQLRIKTIKIEYTNRQSTVIESYENDKCKIVGIYSIKGEKRNIIEKGINIVRFSNGTTKKIFVK